MRSAIPAGLVAFSLFLSIAHAEDTAKGPEPIPSAQAEEPVRLEDVFAIAEEPDLDIKLALLKPWPPMPPAQRSRWSDACVMWAYTAMPDGSTDKFQLLQARGDDLKEFMQISLRALTMWKFPASDKERRFVRVFNFGMGPNHSQRFKVRSSGSMTGGSIFFEQVKYPVCNPPGSPDADKTESAMPPRS